MTTPMQETRSTCPYCGVGCGVVIAHDGRQILGVRGDPDHPANAGRLCSKGSTLHLTARPGLQAQVRALRPMWRPARGQALQPLGWDQALSQAADGLARIVRAHGPDAVGLYLSGQLLTEDYYVFNKLAKGLLGTNNVDTNSRLCMSSAVAGYKQSLGVDAPPACYEDLALARTVMITGSNMAWAHPVLYRRLEDARRAQPDMKLIVVDPRRTETAADADLHLQILPGTDVTLHHALLHVMLWEGRVDAAFIAAHTTGFDALRDRVRETTPAVAARLCGIREDDLVQAARWFSGHTPTLSLYCQGLNQSRSGTDKNSSLINLHLATGQIGSPGAGPFSLTGQPNAMGGREVGGLSNLLSAHRDLANPAHRAEVAALWGLPEVPATPGLSAVEMFQAAADGQVKALWIACTNPAQSLPDQRMVERALQRAELVIVQEAYQGTATAAYADLLLPASTWGEKDGTVTNSERRISRVRRAVPAAGSARDDWRIVVDVAQRLETLLPERRRADGRSLFEYPNAEAVWLEHRESTRGRDLDITGLTYAALAQPQQWPCPEPVSAPASNAASSVAAAVPSDTDGGIQAAPRGQARLYTDGRFATPDGRARFIAAEPRPLAEPRDARYPYSLTSGRLRDQWHGMSRTGTLGRLFAHAPEPTVDVHPQELQRLRVAAGALVRVRSRRGELVLPVRADEAVAPAQAHIAMHWGSEWLKGGVNQLTTPAFCPQSKQPELKHAAVAIEPVSLPWQLVAAAWLPAGLAHERLAAWRTQFAHFDYAAVAPFGREGEAGDDRVGLVFRGARSEPLPEALLDEFEALMDLRAPGTLRYEDRKKGQRRAVLLSAGVGAGVGAGAEDEARADNALQAFLLAGNAQAQAWVLELLQSRAPAATFGRALLSGSPQAPTAMAPASPQVCACFNVSQARIETFARGSAGAPDERLKALQGSLKCGTQCGSCVPKLKTILQQTPADVAAPTPTTA